MNRRAIDRFEWRLSGFLLLVGFAFVLLGLGLGRSTSDEAPHAGPPVTEDTLPADRRAPTPRFVGTALVGPATVSGGPGKGHVVDTLGQGACLLDLDQPANTQATNRQPIAFELFVANGAASSFETTEQPARPNQHEATVATGHAPWTLWRLEDSKFRPITGVKFGPPAWGVGCAVADVDGDGFDDLYVATLGAPDRLLLRRAPGQFEVRELPAPEHGVLSVGGVFADLDGDGDLDLVVSTYIDLNTSPQGPCRWRGTDVTCGPKGFGQPSAVLYQNDGRGHFTATDALAQHGGYGLMPLVVDANLDGVADVFVANDSSPNHLFVNLGGLRFEEAGLLSGVAYSARGATQAGMGVDAGDLDGDLVADLVVTNFSEDSHNLYLANARGQFLDLATPSGIKAATWERLGWSVVAEDFDLDGDLDLLTTNGHVYPQVGDAMQQPLQLLVNNGKAQFTDRSEHLVGPAGLAMAGRGTVTLDLEGDGDLDLIVVRDGEAPMQIENQLAPAPHHSLRVRLTGPPGNPRGIGATVTITTPNGRQRRMLRVQRGYLSSSEPLLTFGLGPDPRVDSVDVAWPDGTQQSLASPTVGPVLVVSHQDVR